MCYQICFQKTRLGLIPLHERASGDVLLEQRPGARCRHASQTLCAGCMQEAVCCGGTHREQLAAARLAELKVPVPLQGLDEGRQKWYESLATDPNSRVPGQEKGVLDLWSISSLPSRPRR